MIKKFKIIFLFYFLINLANISNADENFFSKGLEFYAKDSDIVILVSSSGKSKNILNAAKFCKKKRISLITLSGFSKSNPLRKAGKYNFYVNSKNYNVVEVTHLTILLSVIENLI